MLILLHISPPPLSAPPQIPQTRETGVLPTRPKSQLSDPNDDAAVEEIRSGDEAVRGGLHSLESFQQLVEDRRMKEGKGCVCVCRRC